MLKKITAFICSFLVIILACSAAFLSSARVSEKSIPFPNPMDYVGDFGCAIVYAYHTSGSSTINWRAIYVVPSVSANNITEFVFSGTKLNCNTTYVNVSSVVPAVGLNVYKFNYTAGNTSYSCSYNGGIVEFGNEFKVTNTLSTAWIFDFIQVYGNAEVVFNSPYSQPTNSIVPVFNSDISYSDLTDLFDDVYSDLSTLHSDFNTVNSKLTSIDLYCSEILDELRGEDYTEPPQTTENHQMSDYEEAEKAISDDAFNNLDDFEFAGIGDSLDSFGSGFSGALSFLSSNMEFFTGNQASSYGSNDDDSAIRKISVVILIVLSLGLVSFVLNLVSSKGSD